MNSNSDSAYFQHLDKVFDQCFANVEQTVEIFIVNVHIHVIGFFQWKYS